MENVIIIVILIVVLFFALRSSLKHFAGKGGCCGGGSVPKQKKVIQNVHYRKLIQMEGLHCENCKNSVEKAINSIEGAAAKVNLKEQTAEVVLEKDVADEVLRAAVEKAGFQVTRIRSIA
ncbi:MAG: heavy-metal-associated domain-containing protein [Lachnospiraceae bacterium]|nr:heavy-metal-associated domain-containing protein [Lachnospiraceae bacterium]